MAVKASVAVTAKQGLVIGARTFPGNPYDGHTLEEQLQQTTILLQDIPSAPRPKRALVDKGYRGVTIPGVEILHPGKMRSMTPVQRKMMKRRSAVEPVIGHLKDDCRMRRCWLKGAMGDAIHAVLCAAGYNLRFLLRVIRIFCAWILWLSRVYQRVPLTQTRKLTGGTAWWSGPLYPAGYIKKFR